MDRIIGRKEVNRKLKKGLYNIKIRENLMIIELEANRIYEVKKMSKNGVWRYYTRFCAKDMQSAIDYAIMRNKRCE